MATRTEIIAIIKTLFEKYSHGKIYNTEIRYQHIIDETPIPKPDNLNTLKGTMGSLKAQRNWLVVMRLADNETQVSETKCSEACRTNYTKREAEGFIPVARKT